MSGAHTPTYPTAHKHFILSWLIVQYPCIMTSCAKRTYTPSAFCSPFSVSLLYSFKRENIPFLGAQKWVTNRDMSDVYTCTPSPHPSPFGHPYFLSWTTTQERKLYTRIIPPFRGTQEMSDKLRYESQIILRYYPLIIHELSLERPSITSPFKTITLERKTASHLLSHWTTHLQYWWKDYAYSLSQ